MKSNIYSVFVFLIGLSISYVLSVHLTQSEKKVQKQAIKIESQTISHNIQHHVQINADQILLLINRWHSINDINQYCQSDAKALMQINPNIEKIKLFPLSNIVNLTLPDKDLITFKNKVDKKRKLRDRKHLPLTTEKLNATRIYISHSYRSPKQEMLFDLQLPIIIDNELIAYIEVTLNINKLLTHKIDTFQITKPFSLSENGITLFNSLPKTVHINDVTEQFNLPIFERQWKLMIWSNVAPRDKELFLIFTLLISLLTAITIKMLSLYFTMQKRIIKSDNRLKRVDDEFRNSKAKLIQSNKLTSLGEIATGIAHEINQPLQVICIHTEMCQENITNQNYHLVEKSFKAITSQIDRIEKIVKQVGSFGRDSELDNYQEEEANDIFENVIAIIVNQYKQDMVELRQVIPPSLPSLYCNKTQIEQVLVNLLINAKDSVQTSHQKIVFIKAHVQDNNLFIQVSDTGSGIDPTKINDIFTPFYTTKPLGKGTGLGLSISYSMIHQHKGDIKVSSEIGKGSVFTVRLPFERRKIKRV